MKKAKGKYYVIYTGIAEFCMEDEAFDTYDDAEMVAKDQAHECCQNYTIVQAVSEVQYHRVVKVKKF